MTLLRVNNDAQLDFRQDKLVRRNSASSARFDFYKCDTRCIIKRASPLMYKEKFVRIPVGSRACGSG